MHSPQPVSQQVRAEIKGPVGYLILDRPERKNALSFEMWKEIARVISEYGVNKALRVVVLRGAAVCRSARARTSPNSRPCARMPKARAPMKRLTSSPSTQSPPAAADDCDDQELLHGRRHGSGRGLRSSRRERERGICHSAGQARPRLSAVAIRYIVAAIGPSNTKDLLYTARRVKAVEAEKLGLINKLTTEDALESEVEKLAGEIAQNAPLSLKAGKLAIDFASGYAFADGERAVKDAANRCFDSADYREGRAAFLEKRKAQFRGE